MKISLCIVTYNRSKDMERLLDNLLELEDLPEQIVIIDDSEEPDTENIVENKREELEQKTKVYYNRSGEKRTFGESRNEAIENAEHEIINFIDDDTILTENYFTTLRQTYKEFPEAAGVGGPAITTDLELKPLVEILHSDKNQNKYNKYGEVKDESDKWIPSKPVETDTFRGANMSFKKQKLQEINGFDPGYKGTGYREEQDVMIRLRKKGEKLIYQPELKLYHLQTQTGGTRDINVETEYWKGRNMIRFVKKNFPQTYPIFLLKLLVKTKDGDIPPIWKDLLGAIIYRKPGRLHKWKGYTDEILNKSS